MRNERLTALDDYPFERLRTLLRGLAPPAGVEPRLLHIGEPRHPAPAMVARVLAGHAAAWGRYPPRAGTQDLRAAIAAWLTRRFALPAGMVDEGRHILPVPGTRGSLFLAAALAVNARREGPPQAVLMPNPLYQVYYGAAVMAGADPILLPATRETGFQPDLEAVPEALLARTALLYVNSPANPQGSVAGLDRLKAAVTLARAHGFVLAVDECYSEIYTEDPPPGALQACAALGGALDNVLVFHSLSKRSNVPGLRSGFLAGDASLIDGFLRLRDYGGATVPLPVMAASAALWRDEAHVTESRALYRRKFDLAMACLDGHAARPGGGFFLWLDVRPRWQDGEAAARALWSQAGIMALPGAYMARDDPDHGNPGAAYLRLALVHDVAATQDALGRIATLINA